MGEHSCNRTSTSHSRTPAEAKSLVDHNSPWECQLALSKPRIRRLAGPLVPVRQFRRIFSGQPHTRVVPRLLLIVELSAVWWIAGRIARSSLLPLLEWCTERAVGVPTTAEIPHGAEKERASPLPSPRRARAEMGLPHEMPWGMPAVSQGGCS